MTNSSVRNAFWCKFSKHLLAASWCLGLLLGALAAQATSDTLVPMILGALRCSASIRGLLICAVLPFLFSALAVSLSEPWLLLPVSSLKAFGFGFCAYGVASAFGSAGWLVRLLFLFTDICTTPLLFFYWIRHVKKTADRLSGDLAVCVAAAATAAVVDYCLISPFLVELIEF